MKRRSGIFEKIVDPANLELAADLAARGKKTKKNVKRFECDRGANLARIRAALESGTWKPQGYSEKYVYEPKKRLIKIGP